MSLPFRYIPYNFVTISYHFVTISYHFVTISFHFVTSSLPFRFISYHFVTMSLPFRTISLPFHYHFVPSRSISLQIGSNFGPFRCAPCARMISPCAGQALTPMTGDRLLLALAKCRFAKEGGTAGPGPVTPNPLISTGRPWASPPPPQMLYFS